jgi:hypothetical protein
MGARAIDVVAGASRVGRDLRRVRLLVIVNASPFYSP